MLASVGRDYPKSAEAQEAAWRVAQCKREAGMEQLMLNRRLLGKRDTAEAAGAAMRKALDQLREAGKMMAEEAKVKAKAERAELAAQIASEAAWCWRMVAEFEAENARTAAQEEARMMKQRRRERSAAPATKPATQPVPNAAESAAQQALKEARAYYQMMLEFAEDSALGADAKVALAELDQPASIARLARVVKRKNVPTPARTPLPAILNLKGTSELPRLEPFTREDGADLIDEAVNQLDATLLDRTILFPEDITITR
jgi:hypothetical protein